MEATYKIEHVAGMLGTTKAEIQNIMTAMQIPFTNGTANSTELLLNEKAISKIEKALKGGKTALPGNSGVINFGSRTDMELTNDSKVLVRKLQARIRLVQEFTLREMKQIHEMLETLQWEEKKAGKPSQDS